MVSLEGDEAVGADWQLEPPCDLSAEELGQSANAPRRPRDLAAFSRDHYAAFGNYFQLNTS